MPGCSAGGSGDVTDYDYCILPHLINLGPYINRQSKLGQCEGDCDKNADCQQGLVCYQRDQHSPVPGCSPGGTGDLKN